ncbi:cytoplasmic dynein 2 light intermediate chain 1 [Haematobia irritans]|uniref:cytoplasmic dynein 2 light intermediate chain 1 n=1 Tax=Haematobia irritans TaxID=7368 RepID=UPI003F4FC1AA
MSDTLEASKSETIQDIALKLAEEQLKQLQIDNGPRERTVFVLGSKGVGKTTAINAFFDREEAPRPTLALDYSYGRKTGPVQKHICHMWELGSVEKSEELICVPLKSHGVENMACVIMVDLSQPQRLWSDLMGAYKVLRDYSDKLLSHDENCEKFFEKTKERIKKDHMDLATLDLMPFPVVIVGAKYDLFISCEPEKKKHICRCLRSISHLIGGCLLFYSHKIQKLSKTLKDTFSHLAFGSPSHPFRMHTTDYNDALSIWFGTDSWDKISSLGIQTLPSIEANLTHEIPQDHVKHGAEQQQHHDPAKDPGFRESIIDEMRAQKDEELQGIIRDSMQQLRGKFESVK